MAESGNIFTFFWGTKSPFSQWHPCQFTVDGILYNCAEQYMMHQKAILFGDKKSADKVMESSKPRQQKALGRKVNNFDEAAWQANCDRIVKEANMAKFSQNKKLRRELFATAGTEIVEASPYDTIWGIGLTEDDPSAQQKSTWQGQNKLGIIITEVREELMNNEKDIAR